MYLNQTALWNSLVVPAVNTFGDFKYSEPAVPIKVRKQEHVQEVRLKDGTVTDSKYIYYTHADVKVDDKIDGRLVVASYKMNTLGGRERLRRLITI